MMCTTMPFRPLYALSRVFSTRPNARRILEVCAADSSVHIQWTDYHALQLHQTTMPLVWFLDNCDEGRYNAQRNRSVFTLCDASLHPLRHVVDITPKNDGLCVRWDDDTTSTVQGQVLHPMLQYKPCVEPVRAWSQSSQISTKFTTLLSDIPTVSYSRLGLETHSTNLLDELVHPIYESGLVKVTNTPQHGVSVLARSLGFIQSTMYAPHGQWMMHGGHTDHLLRDMAYTNRSIQAHTD
jgi:hypothetical protein